jgi:hypothetical protein
MNEQYRSLWEQNDGAQTFIVIDIDGDEDLGNIVCESEEMAYALLRRAIELGVYTPACALVQILDEGTYN